MARKYVLNIRLQERDENSQVGDETQSRTRAARTTRRNSGFRLTHEAPESEESQREQEHKDVKVFQLILNYITTDSEPICQFQCIKFYSCKINHVNLIQV